MMNCVYVWLSRHELSEEQKKDFFASHEAGEIVMLNVTWQATENDDDDATENGKKWSEILAINPRAILGVFPPVALESVTHHVPIYSPISRQVPKDRLKEGQIPFQHVRWSRNLN